MAIKRTDRLNSSLKQVISDVIRREVKNPHLPELITITQIEITNDLRHAKVYVSVIGDAESKKKALAALQSAAGFIALRASKQVVMRYFPELTFYIDDSVEKQGRLDDLLNVINKEREERESKEREDHAEP